ncbi:MAG: 2-phosphosulfolactate phosphatase [Clostridia bacterium]|nr:2-phosphosulfolactate phosphatase [Clostridia bacterium]
MLKLDICLTVEEMNKKDVEGKAVVVIDVFRASSTIITAVEQGCRSVIPVLSEAEAWARMGELKNLGMDVLIAGERKGIKIPGFHLGNSPTEFKERNLTNKTILLTTSNGTRGIHGARGAGEILIGALMNAGAVAKDLSDLGLDILYVCCGRLGEFSLEDFLAAGAITYYLGERESLRLSDVLLASAGLFESKKEDIIGFLEKGEHSSYLQKIDYGEDIGICSSLNSSSWVPRYQAGVIKP